MKNTLLAVLIIALCYDPTQAQSTPLPTPGYIKYQGEYSNQSIDKEPVRANRLTDGVATTDKLANDIITSNKMADGVISSDKLAEDIINSLKEMEEAKVVNRQTSKVVFMASPRANAMATDQHAYAWHMQNLLLHSQQKPRPTRNRIGWLPL
jgi:hypothetical protein